jgi:hypothetical membrane protein
MMDNIYRTFCFIATGLIIQGILFSAIRYRGKRGERFSLFNHFISELGEVGISPAARVFNTSLVISGVLLIPYIIWLGLEFNSLAGWLGCGTGIIASLAVACVGIFPMNKLTGHGWAAMTYFRAGLAMVFFFGLAILLQAPGETDLPPEANLLSLLAFTCYGAFLLRLSVRRKDTNPFEALDPDKTPDRPRIWLLPILEWAVFFSTILWLFGTAWLVGT